MLVRYGRDLSLDLSCGHIAKASDMVDFWKLKADMESTGVKVRIIDEEDFKAIPDTKPEVAKTIQVGIEPTEDSKS
jgi:hypothetical protein